MTNSPLDAYSERFKTTPEALSEHLKNQAFKHVAGTLTHNEYLKFLQLADRYALNPLAGEIFVQGQAPDALYPVVNTDVWIRLINQHPQFDGLSCTMSECSTVTPGGLSCPEWIECVMYRKDRNQPITVRTYFDEAYPTFKEEPTKDSLKRLWAWQTQPKRMLRERATIQAAITAFGCSDLFDSEEIKWCPESELNTHDESDPLPQETGPSEKMTAMGRKLIERAERAGGAFQLARAYAEQHFSGGELDYLLSTLRAAEHTWSLQHPDPLSPQKRLSDRRIVNNMATTYLTAAQNKLKGLPLEGAAS